MGVFVYRESLLIVGNVDSLFFDVLAGNMNGRTWINGPVIPARDEMKPATIRDFELFRVCHKGYL